MSGPVQAARGPGAFGRTARHLGLYALFSAAGGAFVGLPSFVAMAIVATVAVTTAAAAGMVPALLVQRMPVGEALAAK